MLSFLLISDLLFCRLYLFHFFINNWLACSFSHLLFLILNGFIIDLCIILLLASFLLPLVFLALFGLNWLLSNWLYLALSSLFLDYICALTCLLLLSFLFLFILNDFFKNLIALLFL